MSTLEVSRNVSLDRLITWVRDSWFWCESLSSPVRVEDIASTPDNSLSVIGPTGIRYTIDADDINTDVPSLGYINVFDKSGNPRAYYFQNLIAASWKKGLQLENINVISNTVVSVSDKRNRLMPKLLDVYTMAQTLPSLYQSIFKPIYYPFSEALALSEQYQFVDIALSEDFAVAATSSALAKRLKRSPYSLFMYRGFTVGIQECYGEPVVLFNRDLSFILDKVNEELKHVSITVY